MLRFSTLKNVFLVIINRIFKPKRNSEIIQFTLKEINLRPGVSVTFSRSHC